MNKSASIPSRIAILGPESTGKSVLARELALHYSGSFVPEFARGYLSALDHPYELDDVLRCRKGQQELEEQALAKGGFPVFFDTDATINFDIWLEEKYGVTGARAESHQSARYDFYLLTLPDLPFEPDPLRENPHRRQYLFDRYEKAVQESGIPYEIISGIGKARLRNAVQAIEAHQSEAAR